MHLLQIRKRICATKIRTLEWGALHIPTLLIFLLNGSMQPPQSPFNPHPVPHILHLGQPCNRQPSPRHLLQQPLHTLPRTLPSPTEPLIPLPLLIPKLTPHPIASRNSM